tara:strand:+ start:439 stop:786 length:348 start_codon:yes stop_codon:yes gene_type:complete
LDIIKKLAIPIDIVARTLFQIIDTIIAIKAEYNLKFSIKKKFLFSIIDRSLTIMGVNTAKGIYLNEYFTDNGKLLEIIPERGINLIKKVMTPHKIIKDQIIFYPIYLKLFLLRYQ